VLTVMIAFDRGMKTEKEGKEEQAQSKLRSAGVAFTIVCVTRLQGSFP